MHGPQSPEVIFKKINTCDLIFFGTVTFLLSVWLIYNLTLLSAV